MAPDIKKATETVDDVRDLVNSVTAMIPIVGTGIVAILNFFEKRGEQPPTTFLQELDRWDTEALGIRNNYQIYKAWRASQGGQL